MGPWEVYAGRAATEVAGTGELQCFRNRGRTWSTRWGPLLPEIAVIPTVDPETGRVAVVVPLLDLVERILGRTGLTTLVQPTVQRLEARLDERGLRVTSVRVDPTGMRVTLERT
jgi:hypothetical protein